tara:strand:- start:32 stop:517 length:486 start_codon:yes stop_codon:yes gene_type:complete
MQRKGVGMNIQITQASHATTRRRLMKSLPAAALTFCAANTACCGASQQIPKDPFLDAYNIWIQSQIEFSRVDNLSASGASKYDELDRIWEVGAEAVDLMADISPSSPEGLAALAHVIFAYHGPNDDPGSAAYSEAIKYTDIRLLENLYKTLSGERALPDGF